MLRIPYSLNSVPDPGFAESGSNPDPDPDPDSVFFYDKNILVGNKKRNIFLLKTLKRTLRLHEKPTECSSNIISKLSFFGIIFACLDPDPKFPTNQINLKK